jgi:hypothetical protein
LKRISGNAFTSTLSEIFLFSKWQSREEPFLLEYCTFLKLILFFVAIVKCCDKIMKKKTDTKETGLHFSLSKTIRNEISTIFPK